MEWYERRNNREIAAKVGKIRVEGNRGTGSGPKKKWMGFLYGFLFYGENMMACGENENMVRD